MDKNINGYFNGVINYNQSISNTSIGKLSAFTKASLGATIEKKKINPVVKILGGIGMEW